MKPEYCCQRERRATYDHESSEQSAGDLGGIVVVGNGVSNGSEQCSYSAREDSREEKEGEEESWLELQAAEEVDDDIENGKLDDDDGKVCQGLGDKDDRWSVHAVCLVLGHNASALESDLHVGESHDNGV
jgi:hypothetical protein